VKLVANARMYTVTIAAGAAWKQLFAWLARRSGVPLEPIDHAFPAPLSQLWSRSDLGCAFLCGFPYVHSPYRPKPIAAPVPSPVRFGGRAVYMTDLVVRAGSAFHTLEDTLGNGSAIPARTPTRATMRCATIFSRFARSVARAFTARARARCTHPAGFSTRSLPAISTSDRWTVTRSI
jgi:hypothetical protein